MPDRHGAFATRENTGQQIFTTWTCPRWPRRSIILAMSATPPNTSIVRRVVLVPAGPTSSRSRDDELVRRYRLARMRLMGPETTPAASLARSRGG
jgi:hypothetical protein